MRSATWTPTVAHPLNPGAWDPAARVADMDTLGIDRAVVYPTLINEYLPQIVDRDAATVLCRAYNDWLWDFSEATGGRLHPVAVLPLQDPAAALEELNRVHGKGFRAVLFRPAFFWLQDPSGSVGAQMLEMMAQMQSGADRGHHQPAGVHRGPAFPTDLRAVRRARGGGLRPPVVERHRPGRDLQRGLRRAGVGAPRSASQHRGADRRTCRTPTCS